VVVSDGERDLARLCRWVPSKSASEGRCLRTRQHIRTGSGGQAVLRAFGAARRWPPPPTQEYRVVQEAAGCQRVARRSPGGRQGMDTAAREANTCPPHGSGGGGQTHKWGPVRRPSCRRTGPPREGAAHTPSQSRLGPNHHYVKLSKRCKKISPFTPPKASGEHLISW